MSNFKLNRQIPLSNKTPMLKSSQIGYNSAREHRPFNPELFTDPADQRNYERARLRATNMMASGNTVPPLTPTGCAPKKLLNWMAANHDYIPTRKSHLPEDMTLSFGSTLDRRGFPKPIPTYR